MDGEIYVTAQGDTWDTIALAAYGDEVYADWVMQNNLWCLDVLIFPAGVAVNTPALLEDEVGEDGTPDAGEEIDDEDDPYAEDGDEGEGW